MIALAESNCSNGNSRFLIDGRPTISPSTSRSNVYFFLDFSNIAISAGHLAAAHGDSILGRPNVRLHAANIRSFVERGRFWRRGFAAAGLSNQQSPIKSHFQQCGIEFEICERGEITGKEQNVDERIRMEMLELLYDDVPLGTIVLATGDGNGSQENRGFVKTLKIMRQNGFSVEVMSWRHSLSSDLRDWSAENGKIIELDAFYEDLTFVPGCRAVTPTHQLLKKLARLRMQ
jgi:hypothetical protein